MNFVLPQATLSQQDRYFSQKLHDLDKAIQDVRLIAYGKYSNGNNSPDQQLQSRRNNISKMMRENRLPPVPAHHQILDKMTSRSETCIIVISDTEAADDDVFSS